MVVASKRFAAIAAGAIALLSCGVASAHGGGTTARVPTASELEPGPIKRMILDVKASVTKGEHDRQLVEPSLAEAVAAADRARSARAAGDGLHGSMLDRVAKQWAEVAAVVIRAAESERMAAAAAASLEELSTKVQRAEALLTELQSRLGRLQAEVTTAEAARDARAAKAAAKEAKRVRPGSAKRNKAKR